MTDTKAKFGFKADINTEFSTGEEVMEQAGLRVGGMLFGSRSFWIAADNIASCSISKKRQGRQEVKEIESSPINKYDSNRMDNYQVYEKGEKPINKAKE